MRLYSMKTWLRDCRMRARQVVFSPFGKDMAASGPDSDEPRLFLVVYQHGNSIWAGPPASAVSRLSRVVIGKGSCSTLMVCCC